jgi:hypothetical protein
MNQVVALSPGIFHLSHIDEFFCIEENCTKLDLILLLKVFFLALEKAKYPEENIILKRI